MTYSGILARSRGLALLAALVAAPTIRWIDEQTGWKVFGYSPDGARAVLGDRNSVSMAAYA